jgi:hypothetical protein
MPKSDEESTKESNTVLCNIRKSKLLAANDSISSVTYSIPMPKLPGSLPMFIEACCGSAKLSFEVKAKGVFVLPVDWIQNKHRTRVPAIKLDLSLPSQVAILSRLVEQGLVAVVWAAVPCGTASKAREIRVSKKAHGPKPTTIRRISRRITISQPSRP